MAQTVRSRIEAAAKKLRNYGQEHLLQFVEELSQVEKIELVEDIESLDFDLIDELVQKYVINKQEFMLPDEILPPEVYPIEPDEKLVGKYQSALEKGECLIAEHKVAAFTVAGGMGTRLNFDGPKGNVPATAVRNKTLFRVFAEGINAWQRRLNCTVPWYVMTSITNHDDTVRSFKDNDYFGLNKEDVMIFPQGMMPCFDAEGKILLAQKHKLAMSPDGHGGSLRALYNSGAIDDMAQRGIKYISYFQVDNPLVFVVDPMFIGLHALDNAEMSSKAVKKCEPLEKVGNFALCNGKVTVIEYSDLPDELARQKTDDGSLMFKEGSIAIHVISRTFVERINSRGFSLPWHRALKRVSHIDGDGKLIEPEEINAVKLETFVFDALPLADGSIIYAIDRDEQFAPIKNASGVDSLESSQKLQLDRAVRWLEQAGVEVPRDETGKPMASIEISPLFALDPAELARKKSQLRKLKPDDIVYLG